MHWSKGRHFWALIILGKGTALYWNSETTEAKESATTSSLNIVSDSNVQSVKKYGLCIWTEMPMQFTVLSSKVIWNGTLCTCHQV